MAAHPRPVSRGRQAPTLVYDGDCGFCTTSIRFVQRRIRPTCTYVAWQFADLDSLGVTEQRAQREVLWITHQGRIHGGSRSVAKVLQSAGGGWSVLGGMLLTP